MIKEDFYNLISDGTINGEIAGNLIGDIGNVNFWICPCGTTPSSPQYYVSATIDDDSEIIEEGTDIEKYYSDFYEAINDFKIKGKTIAQQIGSIENLRFLDYTN